MDGGAWSPLPSTGCIAQTCSHPLLPIGYSSSCGASTTGAGFDVRVGEECKVECDPMGYSGKPEIHTLQCGSGGSWLAHSSSSFLQINTSTRLNISTSTSTSTSMGSVVRGQSRGSTMSMRGCRPDLCVSLEDLLPEGYEAICAGDPRSSFLASSSFSSSLFQEDDHDPEYDYEGEGEEGGDKMDIDLNDVATGAFLSLSSSTVLSSDMHKGKIVASTDRTETKSMTQIKVADSSSSKDKDKGDDKQKGKKGKRGKGKRGKRGVGRAKTRRRRRRPVFNEVCLLSCATEGYEGVPDITTTTCMDGGEWSSLPSTGCSAESCIPPLLPKGYVAACKDGVSYKDKCTISCDPQGYSGVPDIGSMSCLAGGEWSLSPSKGCQADSCITPCVPEGYTVICGGQVVQNETVTISSVALYGDVCEVECQATGYSGSPDVTEITCTDEGGWSTLPRSGCVIRDCGLPPKQLGFSYDCGNGTSYGDICSVTCQGEGYHGTPDIHRITCQGDGTWTALASHGCSLDTCSAAPSLPAGYSARCSTRNQSDDTASTYGSICRLQCDEEGYTGAPNINHLECVDDGQWSFITEGGKTQSITASALKGCAIDTCAAPALSEAYSYSCQSSAAPVSASTSIKSDSSSSSGGGDIKFGDECSISCKDVGYHGTPDVDSVACLDGGEWSKLPSQGCVIDDCGPPILSPGFISSCTARRLVSGANNEGDSTDDGEYYTSFESSCNITCDQDGYTGIPNHKAIVCEDGGVWSSLPTSGCIIDRCTTPQLGEGYIATCDGDSSFGEQCSITCDPDGYSGTPNINTLTCSDGGDWSTLPSSGCVKDACPPPALQEGYAVNECEDEDENKGFGSSCKVTCDPVGYSGKPDVTSLMCMDDGRWSKLPSSGCQLDVCSQASVSIPEGYEVICTEGTEYHHHCTVVCDNSKGYYGHPDVSSLACLDNGEWSRPMPATGCALQTCTVPKLEEGYTVVCSWEGDNSNDVYVGDECSIVCNNNGYAGTPNVRTIQCLKDDEWSQLPTTGCLVNQCSTPKPVLKDGYIATCTAGNQFNDSCSIACNSTGYSGSPDLTSVTCLDDGQWSASPSSGCVKDTCNITELFSTLHTGYRAECDGAVGAFEACSLICDPEGYTGVPDIASVSCTDGGKWSTIPSSGCTIDKCEALPVLPVGYALVCKRKEGSDPTSAYEYGETCRVECDSVAKFQGDPDVKVVKCSDGGRWSASPSSGCALRSPASNATETLPGTGSLHVSTHETPSPLPPPPPPPPPPPSNSTHHPPPPPPPPLSPPPGSGSGPRPPHPNTWAGHISKSGKKQLVLSPHKLE